MPNLLQDGATWLGARLKESAGRTVTIRQGRTTLTEITATVAMQEYDVKDEDGIATTLLSYDWLFTTADLSGLEFRDDTQIEESMSGVTSRYEAMLIGDKRVAENADTSGILTLLSTRKVY